MYTERLYKTLVELLSIPSTSGHEEQIRLHLEHHLSTLGLSTSIDGSGNLIATLAGEGQALLLNAHMDRVPPGLGHRPVLRDGVLYSDGATNLGADDAAGMTIILEAIRRTIEQRLPHPPLVLVFTVQEETGLCGATNFDAAKWHVKDGIVFDNAFEAGVVVSKGAAYEAFDVTITGRTGHPGKELAQTVDAIAIFRAANYPYGSFANDQTRIAVGRISGGTARNAVPDRLKVEGEMRSFEAAEERQRYKQAIQDAFVQAADRVGGHAEVHFQTHSNGYALDPDEPLLQMYRRVLLQREAALHLQPTFIGSDTSGFRPAVRAFTVSTGVVDEHSVEEHVALAPLEQLVSDTIQLFALWSEQAV